MAQSGPKRRPIEKSGHPYKPTDRRMRLHQFEKENSRKRLILIFGATVLTIISGLIILGWYVQYHSPPRVKAAVVNDIRFSQGDLVKRVRMIQAAQDYRGESGTGFTDILRVLYNNDIDVSLGPFNLGMVQMELLKQGAPDYGISVTEKDIDRAIKKMLFKNAESLVSVSKTKSFNPAYLYKKSRDEKILKKIEKKLNSIHFYTSILHSNFISVNYFVS